MANLARGHLDVLLANGIDDFRCGEAAGLELPGVEPDAHAVVAGRVGHDVTYAWDSAQRVSDTNSGVVAHIELVKATVGRKKGHEHEDGGGFLLGVYAFPFYLFGKLWFCQGDPVLHQDIGLIKIGPYVKGYGQGVGAVTGADGGHVDHILDPDHFLLDG